MIERIKKFRELIIHNRQWLFSGIVGSIVGSFIVVIFTIAYSNETIIPLITWAEETPDDTYAPIGTPPPDPTPPAFTLQDPPRPKLPTKHVKDSIKNVIPSEEVVSENLIIYGSEHGKLDDTGGISDAGIQGQSTDETLIFGKYKKGEWDVLRSNAYPISVTPFDEQYIVTFSSEYKGDPAIYAFESLSEGYLYIPFACDKCNSPNTVWIFMICNENGDVITKKGVIGQMENSDKMLFNVPISTGKTYLLVDLVDDAYISTELSFGLHFSLGKYKIVE